MIKVVGRFCDWTGRIMLFSTPFVVDIAAASAVSNGYLTNDSLRSFATTYSYFLLIIASLIFLVLGSVVGYFYPTPEYGVKPYPKWLKLIISVGGGILGFIYYVETKNDIAPVIIIWVACISFVFPAIIHLIHAGIIKFVMGKANLTDEDIKRIQDSFNRDQEK